MGSPRNSDESSTAIVLGELLGRGAYARVYEGTWDGKKAAIKKMTPFDPEHIKKYENEIRIMEELTKLRAPYIVEFYGAMCDEIQCLIAMQHISGRSLMRYMTWNSGKPFTPLECYKILKQLAHALMFLHKTAEIIHRDVNTANVFIDVDKGDIVLGDFGLAKKFEDLNKDIESTTIVGAPACMAPEVILGALYTPKSDIYSFGMVAWDLVDNGENDPYPSDNPYQIIRFVLKGQRPTIPVGCDDQLSKVIKRCWVQGPTLRPTAEQLLADMDSLIEENESRRLKM
ncbi:MAG: hypothetical protein EPO11_01100 [Gammaproteobacteria bacterium]|nr:MAG: hypothetical protein EPO11_01100 [Gammaproteobacteria bacterium]